MFLRKTTGNSIHSHYANSRVEIRLKTVGNLIDLTENFDFIKTEPHHGISDFRLIAFMFEEFVIIRGGSYELSAG